MWNRYARYTWTKDLSTTDIDFYDVSLEFNDRGDILSTVDHVMQTAGTTTGEFDHLYGLDSLGRLLEMDRGHISGGSISTPKEKRDWSLTATGNWASRSYDYDGSGSPDFAEDNTPVATYFNTANEWILRNVTGGTPVALAYDANGNMIDDGEHYTYTYDAWSRLVAVHTTGGSPALVAEYRYNGLGQRISESDGTDTEYLIYDDSWQLISRHDGTAYTEEILHHHAGLDGLGGSSAMDSVILRRTFLSSGSPQTEDKRWYILQNWRNDPVVTLTDAGVQVERVHFSPYGEAFGIPSGDLDFNGEATLAEEILLSNWDLIPLAYQAYADINLDGVIDAADAAAASGATMGRGVLSHVGSRIGYAGYVRDAYIPTVSHVRHRVYKSDLGRWLQRDPAGYVDGPSLYEYAMGAPVRHRDPMGLAVDWDGPSGPGGGGSPEAKGCDWDDWRSPEYQIPNKRVPPSKIPMPPNYPYPWDPSIKREHLWINPYITPDRLCRIKVDEMSYLSERMGLYSHDCINESRQAAYSCCKNPVDIACKTVYFQALENCRARESEKSRPGRILTPFQRYVHPIYQERVVIDPDSGMPRDCFSACMAARDQFLDMCALYETPKLIDKTCTATVGVGFVNCTGCCQGVHGVQIRDIAPCLAGFVHDMIPYLR